MCPESHAGVNEVFGLEEFYLPRLQGLMLTSCTERYSLLVAPP
jgi:hypothetical protein